REYATTSLAFDADRALSDSTIFGSLLFTRSSLTALVSVLDQRDTPDTKRAAVQGTYLLNRFTNLFVSAGLAEVDGVRQPEYSAGVSIFLGRSTSTTLGVSRRQGRTQATVDVQRSLPVGTGYGYRLAAENGQGTRTGNGAFQYQTGFGRYELAFSGFDGDAPSLSASGGLVYQRGNFLFTRPVQESFALVRVPGVPNVRIYSNNLEVGRTDQQGEIIIPSLLSYYGNKVRIEDRDIPMEFSVPAVERTIAPPYRGGALVEFAVRRIQTVTGTVVVRTGDTEVVPAYGQITATGSGVTLISPLGNGAEFYLENIAAGTYSVAVDYADGTCTFLLVVPETTEAFIKLGRLVCAAAENPKS
ncbi:MAG: fimbria/pilus outer membrane usher protein, partial [Thermoanaerobaculia bacterium]